PAISVFECTNAAGSTTVTEPMLVSNWKPITSFWSNESVPAVGSGDIQSNALLDCPSGKTDGLIVKPTLGVVCAYTEENGISINTKIRDRKIETDLLFTVARRISLSPL